MVATAPVPAKMSSKLFRYLPWSAAPDMETMTRAWKSTLRENVYMAKLAVLTSEPRMRTTHCRLSSAAWRPSSADPLWTASLMALRVHGVLWSASRTPTSRASCSRVMGMKDPAVASQLWSIGLRSGSTNRLRRRRTPLTPSHSYTSPAAPCCWLALYLHPGTGPPWAGPAAQPQTPCRMGLRATAHRRLRRTARGS